MSGLFRCQDYSGISIVPVSLLDRKWENLCELVCRLGYGGKAAYIHGGRGILAGMLAETPRHAHDSHLSQFLSRNIRCQDYSGVNIVPVSGLLWYQKNIRGLPLSAPSMATARRNRRQ
jgi:hypothetical protein